MRFLAEIETADGATRQESVEAAGSEQDNWAVWVARSFRTRPEIVRITVGAFVPPDPRCGPQIEVMRAEWEISDSYCSCCGARTPWATDRGYEAFLQSYAKNPGGYPFVLGKTPHPRG
jgi:hypothetical protein